MHHEMRRKDRQIGESEAITLLDRGEYGILSTCAPDGQPYGIPLSYCLQNNAIYFHCALEGRKLLNIQHENRCSFCVVGKTELLPDQFATRYESVIISGIVEEVTGEEKQQALEGLLVKYSRDYFSEGLDYIKSKNTLTRVYRLSIDTISGKARR